MSALTSSLADGGIDLIRATVIESAVVAFFSILGVLAVALRARHEWRSAQFKDRVNISLNIESGGTLRIRTVLEDQMQSVILSAYAQKLLKQAVRRTTETDEFLQFPSERDAWLVHNEIINAISEACGPHLLAAAAQGEFQEVPFLFALTYERSKDVRIQKVRVLLVQEAALARISAQADSDKIDVETQNHRQRLRTLGRMYRKLKKDGWPHYQVIAIPRLRA